ncbi:MAG: hypothetical protein RLZZ628_1914, partial [Bacteroidota bacterium]
MKKYYLAITLFWVCFQGGAGQTARDLEEDAPVQAVESYETPVPQKGVKKDADLYYFEKEAPHRDLDPQKWEEITKNIDYSVERAKVEKQKQQQNGKLGGASARPRAAFDPKTLGIWADIIKWIFISLTVGLLAFLILKMINAGNLFAPKSRKITLNTDALNLEDLEANLETADIDPHLQKAIDNKDFTLAIRLYYLYILKELTLSNLIRWKKDKTNQHYLFELREQNHFDTFKQATLIFERVWYGNSVFDESAFNSV